METAILPLYYALNIVIRLAHEKKLAYIETLRGRLAEQAFSLKDAAMHSEAGSREWKASEGYER